jgi:hypothetical protein
MTARIVNTRRTLARKTAFRTASADPLARRGPALGVGLDFGRERELVDAWLERELLHVERVVPAPSYTVIAPTWWLPYRNWLVALAVIAIILAFAGLAPRPTVSSRWDGSQGIVGQSYAVTPTPYNGPAAIYGEAAPNQ